jgi:ABC-type multidrug transport system fused ATPase/permease subunit
VLFDGARVVAASGAPFRRLIAPNLLIAALELASLYVVFRLMNSLLSAANGDKISVVSALLLATALLIKSAVNITLGKHMFRVYAESEARLRSGMLSVAQNAPSSSLRGRSIETVTHEINVYPSNITYSVFQQLVKLMSDLFVVITICVALLINNVRLTISVLVLFGLMAAIVARITVRMSRRFGETTDRSTIKLVNHMGRYLGGRNEIVGSQIERWFTLEAFKANEELSEARANFNFVTQVPRFAFDAVIGVGLVLVVAAAAGGWAPLTQQDIAFGLAAGLKLAPYMTSIIAVLMQLGFSKSIVDGYTSTMESLSDAGTIWGRSLGAALGRGPDGLKLHLTVGDKSLNVGTGQILLVKGRSGSGKTTIAEFIADLAEGRIKSPTPTSVSSTGRRHVAYCSQFPTVLNASLVENIESDETGSSVVKLLLMRYGLTHLESDPELNENSLSGGERQRIGFVRALVSGAEVVILDEPTASIGGLYADKVREDVVVLAGAATIVVIVTHESLFDDIASQRIDL